MAFVNRLVKRISCLCLHNSVCKPLTGLQVHTSTLQEKNVVRQTFSLFSLLQTVNELIRSETVTVIKKTPLRCFAVLGNEMLHRHFPCSGLASDPLLRGHFLLSVYKVITAKVIFMLMLNGVELVGKVSKCIFHQQDGQCYVATWKYIKTQ